MATYRRTQKFGPFRFTITPNGVSTSVGVKGARVSLNSKGEVRRTLSIPGTGISDTKKISGPSKPRTQKAEPPPVVEEPPDEPRLTLEEIAGNLVRSLPEDDLHDLYYRYRADQEDGLAFIGRILLDNGMEIEHLDFLRPGMRTYLNAWMAL